MTYWESHLWLQYLALVGTGMVVSFVNAVSGGGSVLSLPLLMVMGLPGAVANGTNRLGIWMGTVGAMAGFKRKGIFYPRLTWQVGWPGLLGSALGSWIGVTLPDAAFKPVLAIVIVFVVVQTLRKPQGGVGTLEGEATLRSGFVPFLVYAGIGFYGGFIQAGAGLVMIYAFSRLGNLNLIQINSLKVSNTMLFITVSLIVYGFLGKVKWDLALALALGNGLGGFAGGVFQVRKGEGFVRGFLAVSGGGLALKMLYDAWCAIF